LPSLQLVRLEFASLLACTPRGGADLGEQSRNLMLTLKDGRVTGTPPVTLSTEIAAHIRSSPSIATRFAPFLNPAAVLVPVPKSSLQKEGSLWVPARLATAFVQQGLGSRTAAL
jgi:hypothetical protein